MKDLLHPIDAECFKSPWQVAENGLRFVDLDTTNGQAYVASCRATYDGIEPKIKVPGFFRYRALPNALFTHMLSATEFDPRMLRAHGLLSEPLLSDRIIVNQGTSLHMLAVANLRRMPDTQGFFASDQYAPYKRLAVVVNPSDHFVPIIQAKLFAQFDIPGENTQSEKDQMFQFLELAERIEDGKIDPARVTNTICELLGTIPLRT